MKPKNKLKSPVDSIIIDLIIDHYNLQSLSGKREHLTGKDFFDICSEAERMYFEHVMITEELGMA